MWLRALVPVVLIISVGTARAQYLPASVAAEIATARAQYLPPPVAAESPVITEPQHTAVLSSFDADSLGNRSAYVDGTFAPFSGIYESGFRVRAMGNASEYRYLLSDDPHLLGTGRYLEGGLLAGYGVWLPRFSLTGLVGPTFGDIVNQGVSTDKWGAKAVIEMYARPTDWTMGSSAISYSTVTNQLQLQAKAGLKIYGDVYFGPEAKFVWQHIFPWQSNFFTPSNISTLHLGAHVSALNIGPVLIGVSGGWAHDRQLGSGYYGSASLYLPF